MNGMMDRYFGHHAWHMRSMDWSSTNYAHHVLISEGEDYSLTGRGQEFLSYIFKKSAYPILKPEVLRAWIDVICSFLDLEKLLSEHSGKGTRKTINALIAQQQEAEGNTAALIKRAKAREETTSTSASSA